MELWCGSNGLDSVIKPKVELEINEVGGEPGGAYCSFPIEVGNGPSD